MEIRKAQNTKIINLEKQIITGDDVLYSKGKNKGVYKLNRLGVGAKSQQSIAELENLDTNEKHYIYGSKFEDISEKMTNQFGIATGNNKAEKIDNAVKNYTDDIIDSSLNNYKDFKTKSLESEVIHTLSDGKFNGKIEEANVAIANIIMKQGIDIRDNTPLYDHLKNLNQSVSQREREAYSKAYTDFFNTETGQSVEEVAKAVDVLKDQNHITDTSSVIKQFNDKIRQEGSNHKQARNEAILNNISGPKSSGEAVISDIMNKSNNINYSFETDNFSKATDDSITNVIKNIESTKLYDLNKVRGQLETNYNKQVGNIEQELIAQYGQEDVLKMARESMVDTPLSNLETKNSENILHLERQYLSLAETGSDDALSYLGWKDTKGLNAIGQSKIAFGDYVGSKINDLSIDTLREIYSKDFVDTNEAITGTQERIGLYFNSLDKNVNADINRQDILSNRQILSDNSIDNMKSINDAIREAGQEVVENQTTTMKKGAIDTARDFISKGDFKGKTAKGIAMAGAALGLASIVAGSQFTAPTSALTPERKPNGKGSSDVNGNFDNEGVSVQPRIAPPSNKTVRVGENTGVSYRISGKANGQTDLQSIIGGIQQTIKKFTGPQLRVDVSTQTDTREVSDSWLEEKVANLLR